MFKPEDYIDSVNDLLDDEQTLVAENIVKSPLDMQERYMSLVPDELLDFIVKQWRPGMTSDQADQIFKKYSTFKEGGSVTTPKRGLVDEAGSYSGDKAFGQKYLYKKRDDYYVVRAKRGDLEIRENFRDLDKAKAYAKKLEEKFDKVKKIVPSVTGKKLTVYNKYAQDIYSKDFNELTKEEKYKVKNRYRTSDGKFRKTFRTNPLTKIQQQKIEKAFPDIKFEFKEGQKYGVPPKIKGKRNPVHSEVGNFVNNDFKLSTKKSLPVSTQRDIVANFELPEGVKEWNFDVNKKGYRYGIPDTGGKNTNLAARIRLFVNEPKQYKIAADFATPQGWLLTQMNRAFESGQNPNFIPKYDLVNGKKKIVGFIDNQYGGGKTYYALKKYADKFNGTLMTEHPDFKNAKKYIDIANRAKLAPNKVIKDLLIKGGVTNDRITLNNLLQYMLNEKGVEPTKRALVLHHKGGVALNPTRDFQILNTALNSNIVRVESVMRADPKNITPKNIQFLKDAGASITIDGKTYGSGPKTAIGGFKQAEQFVQNKLESFEEKDFKNLKKYVEKIGCTGLAVGGRVGFETGKDCYLKGVEKINSGKIAKGAEARNFAKFANQAYKLGRGVLKYGIVPEAIFIGAESLVRMGMGDTLTESLQSATSYLPGGTAREDAATRSRLEKSLGKEGAAILSNVRNYQDKNDKLQSLLNNKELDLAMSSAEGADVQQQIEDKYKPLIAKAEDEAKRSTVFEPEIAKAEELEATREDVLGVKNPLKKFIRGNIGREIQPDESLLSYDLSFPEITQKDLNKRVYTDEQYYPRELMQLSNDQIRRAFPEDAQAIIDYKESIRQLPMSSFDYEQLQGFNIPETISRRYKYDFVPAEQGTFASGGLASLTRTIPPKRGPNYQGLASLPKYGKQY